MSISPQIQLDYSHIVFQGKAGGWGHARRRLETGPGIPPESHQKSTLTEIPAPELRFQAWLLEKAGLNPAFYRPRPLHRRLGPCLRMLGVGSVADAQELLAAHPQLIPRAIDTMIIGVTRFFRDPDVFVSLKSLILPRLTKMSTRRICSVACSDGAEIYSISILLSEEQGLAGSDLLGVDCRPAAVERARAGLFGSSALSSLPPALQTRYFREEAAGYRIVPILRQSVQWAVQDGFTYEQRESWDMILCRNLAIYLEAEAAANLWGRLTRSLRPQGVLVVGKAERPTGDVRMTRLAPCIFGRTGDWK